jgi:hypothetical protein
MERINQISSSGMAGAFELSVSNLASPTELNSLGTAVPDWRVCRASTAGTDEATLYRLDASSASQSAPYIMNSATAGLKWVAVFGRYSINQSVSTSLTVGADPGGTALLRGGGDIFFNGQTHTFGPNAGAVHVLAQGGNSGANNGSRFAVWNSGTSIIQIGNKSAILGGAYSATPYLYANGGLEIGATSVVIGTDPGGAEIFRAGGSTKLGGMTTIRGASGTLFEIQNSSDEDRGLRIGCITGAGVRISTQSGVYPLILGQDGGNHLTISIGGTVFIGADPGGAELLRGTGDVNFTGLLRSGGVNVNPWRWSNATSVSVANTAAETTLLDTGVGSKSIVANSLKVGSIVRFTASGIITCTGTPNLILKTAVGAVNDEFYNFAMPADYSGRWRVVLELCVNSIGSGGTFSGMVSFSTGDSGNGFDDTGSFSGNQEYDLDAINTTIANAINLTAQWGTANIANEIKMVVAMIEILNANS